MRALTPVDLVVGLVFALATHLFLDETRAPATCTGGQTHGWSASENIAGVDRRGGVPCSYGSPRAP